MNRTAARTWPSIDDFYDEPVVGSVRRTSGEVDYGCWWREGHEHGPWWRVSLVTATNEVYVVCLSPWSEYAGQVELVAEGLTCDALDEALVGWGDRCGEAESLLWAKRAIGGRR